MGILRDMAAIVTWLNLPAGFAVCELGDQMMSGGKVRSVLQVAQEVA